MVRSKWSTQRFGEVNQRIRDLDIKEGQSHALKFDESDNKYIKRMIELNMFEDYNFKHEYEGVWMITLKDNQKKEKEMSDIMKKAMKYQSPDFGKSNKPMEKPTTTNMKPTKEQIEKINDFFLSIDTKRKVVKMKDARNHIYLLKKDGRVLTNEVQAITYQVDSLRDGDKIQVYNVNSGHGRFVNENDFVIQL